MAIFNSYVKLPEGILRLFADRRNRCIAATAIHGQCQRLQGRLHASFRRALRESSGQKCPLIGSYLVGGFKHEWKFPYGYGSIQYHF